MLNSDLIICDNYQQCTQFGELQHATKANKLDQCGIIELGKSIDLKNSFRNTEIDNRLTIFDSTGVAIQDVDIARLVYDTLNRTIVSKL